MDQKISKTERYFDIADMLWKTLLSWRLLIIFVIIGIVAGAMIGIRQNEEYELNRVQQSVETVPEEPLKEQTEEISAESFSEMEMKAIQTVQKLKDVYLEQFDYVENALLMQFDTDSFNRIELRFGLVGEEDTDLHAVRLDYYNCIYTSQFQKELKNVMGADGENVYYNELVDSGAKGYFAKAVNVDDNCVVINVCGKDAEQAGEIADLVEQFVSKKQEEFVAIYGGHTITLNSREELIGPSAELTTYQTNKISALSNALTAYRSQFSVLNDKQKKYLEPSYVIPVTAEPKVEEVSDVTQQPVPPMSVGVTMILGGVIAVFIWLILGVISYLMNNKLEYNDDIESLINTNALGNIYLEKHKDKFGSKIDWLIIKRSVKSRIDWTYTDGIENIACKVQLLLSEEQQKKLCICLQKENEEANKIANSLATALKQYEIEVSIAVDIAQNAKELEKLSNSRKAVIIANNKVWKYKEVNKTIANIERFGGELIGVSMLI